MELNNKDGKESGEIKVLSTHVKFYKFVKEFIPRKIKFKEKKINGKQFIELTLKDAYEFMSKMNYVDNWKSEMHEEFGFWNFTDWKNELRKVGFEIVNGSHPFKSDYIIEKMYKGKAEIYKQKGKELIRVNYPHTNIIISGEKPKIKN